MAPTGKKLKEALIDGACKVFAADGENISVNKVRKQVEDDLGLEEGFFADGEWKQKSKDIIREYAGKLLDGWQPAARNGKNGTKRSSVAEEGSPEPKRQKQASNKAKSMKAAGDSDNDSAPDELGDTEKKVKPKSRDKLANSPVTEGVPTKASPGESSNKELSGPGAESDDEAAPVQAEDEYSDVIDEPPTAARKRKRKSDSKPSSDKKEKGKKAPSKGPDDPHEAEIKKLQSHLTKCGIRKLWHNELKHCGNDPRAKIRHLKKMLSEVGMDGRFSEAKAREIKEMRELMADVEATQEMNALWGMNEGRASRSKAGHRSMKVDSGSDDEPGASDAGPDKGKEDNESDDEGAGGEIAVSRRRARADLAFLGDSSDSE